MAYTRIWSEATPTGAEAANTIDDWFRYTKVDLRERLADIFGIASFTDDPLRPTTLKFKTGTSKIYGQTTLQFRDAGDAATWAQIDANGVNTDKIRALAGSKISFNSNPAPAGLTQTLGELGSYWANIYSKIFTGSDNNKLGKFLAIDNISVGNGASTLLAPVTAASAGFLCVMSATAGTALALAFYAFVNTTMFELNDPTGLFTTVAGTGGQTNIYITAGNLTIQNMTGSPRDYYVIVLGNNV